MTAKISDIVKRYVELRDELSAKTKEYEQFKADTKAKMERIEVFLAEKSEELGVDSFKTEAGTAYKAYKDYVRINDWEEFTEYVLKSKRMYLLQKRVSKLAAKEIMEEEGALPPGLEYAKEITFNVKKS